MTKDGFSFLVMGYTGAKAGQFKEMFIAEFNMREAMLKSDDYILARRRFCITAYNWPNSSSKSRRIQ